MSDIHPDLEWIVKNTDKWGGTLIRNLVFVNKETGEADYCSPNYYNIDNVETFTQPQYLHARHVLGLDDNVMTPEEAELPAEERDYRAEPDMVNKPPHYQLHEGYEVYDLRQDLAHKAQAAGVPHDQFSDWDRALEYLLRMWEKNGVEDAKKGAWYVNKLIGKLESSEVRARELGE